MPVVPVEAKNRNYCISDFKIQLKFFLLAPYCSGNNTTPKMVPAIAIALLLRAFLAPLPPDSGLGATDKFGDFEAHRTWLRTTTTQPLAAWYTHIRSQRLVDGPDEVHRWTVGRNVIKAYEKFGTTASAAGGDLL
jgi:hypothetical protein